MKVTNPTKSASESLDWSPEPQLHSAPETCRILSISPRKLWELTHSGQIGSIRIGQCCRYSREDIVAFIDKCRRPVVNQ
jgi:hypothetical protein